MQLSPLFAAAQTAPLVPLGTIDLLVIVIYFIFVLGIGFYLKRFAILAELHSGIWWGALMGVMGVFYLVKIRPQTKRPAVAE
jgi:hypothetical protein